MLNVQIFAKGILEILESLSTEKEWQKTNMKILPPLSTGSKKIIFKLFIYPFSTQMRRWLNTQQRWRMLPSHVYALRNIRLGADHKSTFSCLNRLQKKTKITSLITWDFLPLGEMFWMTLWHCTTSEISSCQMHWESSSDIFMPPRSAGSTLRLS